MDRAMLDRAMKTSTDRRLEGWRAAQEKLRSSPQAKGLRVLLASEAGQWLMGWLERQYVDGELVGETDAETYFNLGRRDVVVELRRLRDAVEPTGE